MKKIALIVTAGFGLGATMLGYKMGLLILLVATIPLAMSLIIEKNQKMGLLGLALLNLALVACLVKLPTH